MTARTTATIRTSIRRMPWRGWPAVLLSTALAMAVMVGGATIADRVAANVLDRHVGSHVAFGLGLLILIVSSFVVWPAVHAIGGWARRVLQAGLALALVGQGLEAIGAFGYDPYDGYVVVDDRLAQVHDAGIMLFWPGAVLLAAGTLVSLAVWLRRNIRAARRG